MIKKLVIIILTFSLMGCGKNEYLKYNTWVKTANYDFVVVDQDNNVRNRLITKKCPDGILVYIYAGERLVEGAVWME